MDTVSLSGDQFVQLIRAIVVSVFVAAWFGHLMASGIFSLLQSLVIVLWRFYRRGIRRRAFDLKGIEL